MRAVAKKVWFPVGITFTPHYNFIIPRCYGASEVGEMTDNTQVDNAWKHHEENATDTTPEPDDATEKLHRHNGTHRTELGGKSVGELLNNA